MATIYAVAIPQFNIITGAETSTKIGQLVTDIRSAYDMAVLTNMPHRLVFTLATGEYHLEVADRREVLLGDRKLGHDPTEAEEKAVFEEFDERFTEYQTLAGSEVRDTVNDEVIQPTSPLLRAKNRLRPPKWIMVDDLEWRARRLGPHLGIISMQAEHHETRQMAADLGPEGRAMLYFFPSGYVEKAVIYVGVRSGDAFDENQTPYTVITKSYEGEAEALNGMQEVDLEKGTVQNQ